MPSSTPATDGWVGSSPPSAFLDPDRSVPIGGIAHRQRVQVQGRIRSIRVRPWGEVATLEAVVVDETGGVTVAFLGRRAIAGIVPGEQVVVAGMVGHHRAKLVVLNPVYRLLPRGD